MNISVVLIRIVVLVLPGILASAIYAKLRRKTHQKDWEDFREIALFSLFSYLALGVLVFTSNWLGVHFIFSFTAYQALFDEKIPLDPIEIAIASSFAIVFAFLASLIYSHRFINRIAHRFDVSRIQGDEDVWVYFHNRRYPGWVFVRDHKTNLNFFGWVESYSDSDETRELLMRDVIVYSNSKSEPLYQSDRIYLSRVFDDLTIEIPKVAPNANDPGIQEKGLSNE